MKEDTATVNSTEELQALCARITNGELISDHHADEQVAVATILPAMCERACCPFPLTIVHRDKPDFMLRSDHSSIGLEVTRFLAPSRAHATATARRMEVGFTPSRFDFDSPTRSKDQMEHAVVAPSVGLTDWKPIFDQRYVDQVIAIVEEKKQKILVGGDATTDEDWLLIDEHHRMSDLQLDFVVKQSLHRLADHWAQEPHFSKVLILSESVLVDMNQDDSGWRQI